MRLQQYVSSAALNSVGRNMKRSHSSTRSPVRWCSSPSISTSFPRQQVPRLVVDPKEAAEELFLRFVIRDRARFSERPSHVDDTSFGIGFTSLSQQMPQSCVVECAPHTETSSTCLAPGTTISLEMPITNSSITCTSRSLLRCLEPSYGTLAITCGSSP